MTVSRERFRAAHKQGGFFQKDARALARSVLVAEKAAERRAALGGPLPPELSARTAFKVRPLPLFCYYCNR